MLNLVCSHLADATSMENGFCSAERQIHKSGYADKAFLI